MDVTKRESDVNLLLEPVRSQALRLLELAQQKGMKVKIIETYRSQERQDYLYEQGRTRPGKIVTHTRSSIHTTKLAFDMIQNIAGKEYDKPFLDKLGELGKSIGLEWGGDFNGFYDGAHFQNPKKIPIPNEYNVSSWANKAWTWGIENRLIDGTRPKDAVTREELMVILNRLINM